MEIKVQCDCGQKFKFEVEPVHGRMPFTVNCPVCGADGTPRANVILQQLLPPQPLASGSAPPPAPAPAPMRPAGLSISRPQPPPPAVTAAEADPAESAAAEDSPESGGVHVIKLGWKGWGAIAVVVLLGIGGSYLKSAQRSFVRDSLDWVFDKVTGKSSTTTDEATSVSLAGKESAAIKTVLPDDNGIMVLVKQPDAAAVAQGCVDFYAEHNKQKLYSLTTTNDQAEGVFMVQAVDNSYVEIDGAISWEAKDVANVTALSEFLSKKFATTCVCALMGDDAEAGTVVIYENGERKFRCDRELRIRNGDVVDDVKIAGQAWATGLGFQPGADGWKGFTMEDADHLTQQIGFKPSGKTPVTRIALATKPLAR